MTTIKMQIFTNHFGDMSMEMNFEDSLCDTRQTLACHIDTLVARIHAAYGITETTSDWANHGDR